MKKILKLIITLTVLVLGVLLSAGMALLINYDIQRLPLIHGLIIFFGLGYLSSHISNKFTKMEKK